MDEQHQLFEQLETVAKSVNHHLKEGDGIPEHTKENHGKLVAHLEKLEDDPATTDQVRPSNEQRLAGDEARLHRLGDGDEGLRRPALDCPILPGVGGGLQRRVRRGGLLRPTTPGRNPDCSYRSTAAARTGSP